MAMKIYKRQRPATRKGSATIEFAVCLPVIVVLVLGAIECASMIFVKQSLNVVAYEGVRTAIRPTSQNQDVTDRCDQVITERKLKAASFSLSPTNVADVERGQPVTVRATASTDANSVMNLKFFSGDLTAEATMVKE